MKHTDELKAKRTWALVFFAFFLIPLYCRIELYSNGLITEQAFLFWGLLSDALWSGTLSLLLLSVSRGRRLILALSYPVWLAIHLVDLENLLAIRQLSHHSNVIYLLSGEFLGNSAKALDPNKIVATVALLAMSLVSLWLGLRTRHRPGKRISLSIVGVLSVSAFALLSLMPSPSESWQVRNFFAHHLDEMAADAYMPSRPLPAAQPEHRIFTEDLSPLRPTMGQAKNVLVIVVEGLTGAYLKPVTDFLDYTPELTAPGLSEIANEALLLPNFVSHRNQTNRGLYSLLCSDYPKLLNTNPKALQLLSNDEAAERCLPRILRDKGYSTHYFQAADLEFMSKLTVMPFMGFDDVRGKPDFNLPRGYYFSWGPDDKLFFEQSLKWLENLDKQEAPWFATLLTVGTHHPYAINHTDNKLDPKYAAVLAADRAVAHFVQELKDKGLSDDTLILITSDESHGVPNHPFGNNWGMMMALAPDLKAQVHDDVFSTTDLNLSVMDYLNISESRPSLTGRSIFRDYENSRPMLFSQGGSVALSEKKGEITRCPLESQSFIGNLLGDNACVNLRATNGEVFSRSYTQGPASTTSERGTVFALQELADARLQTRGSNKQDIIISQNTRTPLKLNGSVDLLGGQYLNLPHGARISLKLDLSYEGEEGSYSELRLSANDLNRQQAGLSFLPSITLPSLLNKERLRFELQFSTLNAFNHTQTLLRGIARRGHGEIVMHNFTIGIDTKPLKQSPSLQLTEATLTKGNGASQTLQLSTEQIDGALAIGRSRPLPTNAELLFNDVAALAEHGARGFWPTEQWGSWSKKKASINIAGSLPLGGTLKMIGNTILTKGAKSMPTKVFINNVEVAEWQIKGGPKEYSAPIPEALTLESNNLIHFELQRALSSPHDKNPEQFDERKLGLALRSLTLTPAKPL